MQIVILDAYTTNPGDLTWAAVEAIGPTTAYDRTPTGQVVERAIDADVVLTNKTPLAAESLAALPRLKYVGVLATGVNVVDVAAARRHEVVVTNVPEYSTPNVAQATWALILELTNQVGLHAAGVRSGRWTACEDFCYQDSELVELAGLTLGLVGYGRIARSVAAIGRALGMHVIVHRRKTVERAEDGTRCTSLAEVFAKSDIVSLHCPLTAETTGLVNSQRLGLMKPTAFLVNTARGGLVIEDDLAAALNSGRIAGAGLDVLATEPPPVTNPLLTARNCIITPHVAWATRNARARLIEIAAANLRSFLAGTPANVVE